VLARRIAPDLRYLPIGNSLILYRELEEGIEVFRVVHGARRLDGLL
jgi:toxin ParE1/3/4